MTSFAERTLTGADFRAFMRTWPTGVAVVTSTAGPEPVGCTVNTFTSVSLCPPLLLISLARHSGTLAAITRRESFGVNVIGFADRAPGRRGGRSWAGDRQPPLVRTPRRRRPAGVLRRRPPSPGLNPQLTL